MAEAVLRPGPVEWHPLARQYLESGRVSLDRALAAHRPGFPLPQSPEGVAEGVLRRDPRDRLAVARQHLEDAGIGLDRRFEPRRPGFPLP